jgi:hypothetical protein
MSNITCYNCNKVDHYSNESRSTPKGKGKSSITKGKRSSSKPPRENFMVVAAVEDNGHKVKNGISGTKYRITRQETSKYAFMTKIDSSLLKYSHLTEEAYQAVLEQTVFNPENRCKFLVDSGASCHLCIDIMFSHVYDSLPRKIIVGSGEAIVSSKTGSIELDDRIKLVNVLYVPSFGANVLSLDAGQI